MLKINLLITVVLLLLFSSCATFDAQVREGTVQESYPENKKIDKTFYLIGDAGLSNEGESTIALRTFQNYLKNKKYSGDFTIFLGDNIYPQGMPEEGEDYRKISEHRLDVQYESTAGFKGEVFIIPGNHDWYNEGLQGVLRQQDYLTQQFDDRVFQPREGCPLLSYDVNDNVHLIIIDTQWYLEDWNKNPNINDVCEIKDRERFFQEIEREIKKNQQKTIVFAMHHPMYTYGVHGGKFGFSKHLFPSNNKLPLPGLASLVTEIRTQGGVSKQDRFNEKYNELMKRLALIAGEYRIVFASGHEHTLQYTEDGPLHQIVSGSGSKESYATLGNQGLFSYGGQGFVVLDIFEDGTTHARYFGSGPDEQPKLLFEKDIYGPLPTYTGEELKDNFPSTIEASVYSVDKTNRTPLFETVWEQHYQNVYGKKVSAPVALLDTLYGGLEVLRPGDANQTKTLRLQTSTGKEYDMRALRKTSVDFLQNEIINQNERVEKALDTDLPEELIQGFYTSSHPFAAFAVPRMSRAVEVLHSTPKLYYVPKQKALREYNDAYGDQLYMIVEHPTEEFDGALFNYPDDIESTEDLLSKLREDDQNIVDETAYIRARMFNMLIGEWNRNNNQWRWAEYQNEDGKNVFVPISKDRDQVFTNFDGTVLDVVKTLFDAAKQFQTYDENLNDIKWFNNNGISLDRAILKNSSRNDWLEQADYISENLTDKIIDEAFMDLPPEVSSDNSIDEIKRKLKGRRTNLTDIATEYYDYFSKLQIVTGTDNKDHFEIKRENNATTVKVWSLKEGKKATLVTNRTFNPKETGELWIYGLDDEDEFVVTGEGNHPIFTRIVGGHGNDTYRIENGKKLKVYDHSSLPNTVEQKGGANFRFLDLYEYNTYDYKKQKLRLNAITPAIGYNPDEGLSLGLSDVYTVNGFQRNPFSQQHRFNANYFFATHGFDFNYEGEFASVYKTWNMLVTGRYTTPEYTQNFFGYGNETLNFDETLGYDYNRTRISRLETSLSLLKSSDYGSTFKGTLRLQGIKVGHNEGRFVTDENTIEQGERKIFTSVEGNYEYHSADNELAPARGMDFELDAGFTHSLTESSNRFFFLDPSISFYNAISKNQKLVLKTLVQGQFRFGDDYEFYQAAQLGQRTGLRGYRFDRFSGKSALAGSADLRYAFNSFNTLLLPLKIGVFGGYDVGRVWLPDEGSDVWHDSYGLGLWVNSAEALSGTINMFHSSEGWRISLGFGYNF